MATVDLYGTDAQRIRNQYQTSLGRGASDDEVSGWLTGSYGGGGVDDWLKQISSSHEAQQRQPQVERPPQTTPTQPVGQNPYQSMATNIFDPEYRRTGFGTPESGYGPGGVENPAYTGFASPQWQAGQRGNPPSYQDLNFWQSQGVQYQDIFDTTTGQIKPGWQRTARGYERTGGAQAAPNTPNIPGPQGGNYQGWFQSLTQGKAPSPQVLRELEPILNQYGIQIGPRNARGWSDTIILPDGTVRDVIEAATENGGRAWSFFVPGPGGGQTVGLPSSQYSDPHTKLLEELMLARIGGLQSGTDPNFQRLMSFLEQRFNDLQTPGRTGAENEVIRTQALDPIERDRAAAKQRVLERISARGFTPDSGIAQQLLQQVDAAFDAERATSQNVMAANELNRREGRAQQAEGIAAGLYELPQAREREAIGMAGNLAGLGPQRLQLAMQAAGMGGGPESVFNSLMSLANLNQNANMLDQRGRDSMSYGLGSLVAYLMNRGR